MNLVCIVNVPATKELRVNLLKELQVWLLVEHTHPEISHLIRLGLGKWLTNMDFVWGNNSPMFPSCPLNNKALHSLLQLSWYYFHTEINSKKMGIRWATKLIKKTWNLLHVIWKHRCDKVYNSYEQVCYQVS